jgi:voltage-gated potassium channel
MRPFAAAAPLYAFLRRRRRLTWLQALALVAAVSLSGMLGGAVVVSRTDPNRFPDLGTALWWAATTVTTVGYGDVVPRSPGGRLVAVMLMFIGIGSFAFLTAVAASAIVVGGVSEEEHQIEREEREIQHIETAILSQLAEINARLQRLEHDRPPATTDGRHTTNVRQTDEAGAVHRSPHSGPRTEGQTR